jgi:hypothetical protein
MEKATPGLVGTYQGAMQNMGRVGVRAAHILSTLIMNGRAACDLPRQGDRLKIVVAG